MASRLMLSLKKASVQPTGVWSLEIMSTRGGSGTKEGETARPHTLSLDANQEIPETLDQLSWDERDEDVELASIPSLPRNPG